MTLSLDPSSQEFKARRAEARRALDAMDPALRGPASAAQRKQWFEAVYGMAGGDPARVPWANLAVHPLLPALIEMAVPEIKGMRVLDVGCGLGDNAEFLSAKGAKVTAFDFAAEAISWAKQRFPHSLVDYRVEDLFSLPEAWICTFDLICECYTLQAMPAFLHPSAFRSLAALLAPGGRVLLIARARREAEEISGPPWPLPPSTFDLAKEHRLEPVTIEEIGAMAHVGHRHWRAVLRRQGENVSL